ncbi:serine protease [Methanosarcina sp. MSH10X1]|nr:serine protease [Methanosarcina sp. MSH10X1]
MIKAGSSFFYNGRRGITGAVISLKGVLYMVTISHIFKGEGDRLTVDGTRLTVTRILKDHKLALIKLPSESEVEITEFGSPGELELAELINDTRTIHYCRVVNSGSSLLFLGFRCHDMPAPEDSGSPIVQKGKVIGIMTSATLDTCMGFAVSSKVLRSLEGQ